MGRTTGTHFVMALAILSLLGSLFMLAVGLLPLFVPELAEDNAVGVTAILFLCTPICFLVTFIFIGIWWSRKKKEDLIDEMASYLKMYRRVNLDKVAQRMGLSLRDAEKILPECIGRGLVKGYLDRFTGEFIWEGAIDQTRVENKCLNCGGSLDRVVLEGEVMKCSFCGAIIPPGTREN